MIKISINSINTGKSRSEDSRNPVNGFSLGLLFALEAVLELKLEHSLYLVIHLLMVETTTTLLQLLVRILPLMELITQLADGQAVSLMALSSQTS